MRSNPDFSLSVFAVLSIFITASSFAQSANVIKTNCRPAAFPTLTFGDSNIFPKDRSLHHPEDGKALPDGRIIVGDEEFGLRIIDKAGKSRPFGKFKDIGWVHDPPKSVAGPNGMFLEKDGRHLLFADVYSGKIYRVTTKTEETQMIYDHPFGINSVVRDSKGTIWFTQSAKNSGPDEMWSAINRPIDSGAVFYLRGAGDQATIPAVEAAANIYFANGVALDKAEQYLYVAETMMDRVLRFKVDAGGNLTQRETYQDVMTPDNLAFDQSGNLWIASPLSNKVVAVDNKCRSLHTVFEATSAGNSRIQNEWIVRSRFGKPLLELLGPELPQPLPGVLTGMFWSRDGKTFYITGLGKAILRFE
ncbi:MAG: SMP-30/gluconolactonase/LRE family protein [Pyrinomonadaceae bacterium]